MMEVDRLRNQAHNQTKSLISTLLYCRLVPIVMDQLRELRDFFQWHLALAPVWLGKKSGVQYRSCRKTWLTYLLGPLSLPFAKISLQIKPLSCCKANALFLFLFFIICTSTLGAQNPVPLRDTLPSPGPDTAAINFREVRLSGDSLDAPVKYSARDSMVFDNITKKIYLYGAASIAYTTITLEAAYIELDVENSLVIAEARPDSSGNLAGKPKFREGEQEFVSNRMRYNFKTKKGMIYDVRTQQQDVYVLAQRTKFVSGLAKDTSGVGNTVGYNDRAIFTTCELGHPHFGIVSRKQKFISDKLVVVGPSNLQIMGIPTPLVLPFGFFPLTKSRQTGLLFPSNYEFSNTWGFGLRDVGWYFPIGEHINLELRSDLYFRGSFGINAITNYRRRYQYSGSLSLRFDSRKQEDFSSALFFRTNSFGFTWSHRQEQGAHPTANFGGSINLSANNFQNRVLNDFRSVNNTQANSNMSFNKRWPGQPFNLSAAFTHSQNRLTRDVIINFPDVRFQMESLFPFKRKIASGAERWYEKIMVRYAGETRTTFNTKDTVILSPETFNSARFGVRHNVDANTSFKVLKYFNLNPSVTYQETWQLGKVQKTFSNTPITKSRQVISSDGRDTVNVVDTLSFGKIDTTAIPGFFAQRQYSASIGMNTRIFGTLNFKKGFIRGIRHEIRPSFSFNYSPNYLNPSLGYFDTIRNVDLRFSRTPLLYSPFENSIYGIAPQSGLQAGIGYSFNNVIQAKVYSRRDSMEKKVKVIDNLIIGGNYNFAADSLQWSQISLSTTARLFKGVTTVNFNAVFDPYQETASGLRINRFVWDEKRRPLRLEGAALRFVSDLTVEKIRAIFRGEEEEVVTDVRDGRNSASQADDFLSLFNNFTISHNLDLVWDGRGAGTQFNIQTHAINCRGDIQLTKNWAFRIDNIGYDLIRRDLSYPSVGITRDLHCWLMNFAWQPARGVYSFNIFVKSSTLSFLRIPYQRNNVDGLRSFN